MFEKRFRPSFFRDSFDRTARGCYVNETIQSLYEGYYAGVEDMEKREKRWNSINEWPLWAKIILGLIAIPLIGVFIMTTTPELFEGILK